MKSVKSENQNQMVCEILLYEMSVKFSIVAGIMSGMYFLEMIWELFWAGGPGIAIIGATLMRTPLNFT
jgi:hypothetical protein